MANFNLAEAVEANSGDKNNGNINNKRKLCNFCQKTYHRNSLIRHQKICAGKSTKGHDQDDNTRKKILDSCCKENDDVYTKDCHQYGQPEGDPPKLQVFSDGSNTSVECENHLDFCNNGPPKLHSVDDEGTTTEVTVRVTRLMRLNSINNATGGRTTAASLDEDSQLITRSCNKLQLTDELTKLCVPQTLPVIGAKIVSSNSSESSEGTGPSSQSDFKILRPRSSELLDKLKNTGRVSNVPPSKRPLPIVKSSSSQLKKQRQEQSSVSSTSATKTTTVLSDSTIELKCGTCSLEFDSQKELLSHGVAYIQSGNLVCLLCSNKKVDNLDTHFKENHETERKKIRCELCGVTIDRNYHFYHFKEHHSLAKKLKCNLCSKEFSFMQNLLLHKSNDHLKEMHNSKYCQRNGDMMNISEGGGSSSSSSNGNNDKMDIAPKSRYVRRYGAPPRHSSSDSKNRNETLPHSMNGASATSRITNNAMSENTPNSCETYRRPSIDSSDSDSNQPNLNSTKVSSARIVLKRASSDSCESLANKSDSSSDAKNIKTVNAFCMTIPENSFSDSTEPSDVLTPTQMELASTTESEQDIYAEYICKLCPGKFESRFKYLTHIRKFHHWNREQLLDPEYEPEFWCPECGQEFIVRPTLMKHLIIAHEDISDVDDYMERVGYGSRPLIEFQCSVCLLVFDSEPELSFHLRCHGLAYLQYLTANSKLT